MFTSFLNLLGIKECGREVWKASVVFTILEREGSGEKQHLGLLWDELTKTHKWIPAGRVRKQLSQGSAPR